MVWGGPDAPRSDPCRNLLDIVVRYTHPADGTHHDFDVTAVTPAQRR